MNLESSGGDAATTPRISIHVGDIFPDIWAESTIGPLQLHAWARGAFTLLLFHPGAYIQGSEAELTDFARAEASFAERGTRLLGLSQSDPVTERLWHGEIAARNGVQIGFPVISDEYGRIAESCGLNHSQARTMLPVRRSVVIGPSLRVKAIWDYPTEVPRSPVEALRVIDLLRAQEIAWA